MIASYLQHIVYHTRLDLGCGADRSVLALPRAAADAQAIGLDLDMHTLQELRPTITAAQPYQLVCGDALAIPLQTSSMDVVTCRAVLHHIADLDGLFAELQRILRPGGVLLVQDGTRLADAAFQTMNAELLAQGLNAEIHPGFAIPALTQQLQHYQMWVEDLQDIGTATFATPPYTSQVYASRAFFLVARSG